MAKDPFDMLDEELQDTLAKMDEAQLRDRIAKTSLDHAALIEAKENDQDLAEKKEAAKMAGQVYAEGTKFAKQLIKFARRCLGDKAKENGSVEKE